jgi:hypothetical protein
MNMDWNDWLTVFNTAETVMVLIILPLATERAVFWYRRLRGWRRSKRRAQEGQDAVAQARPEDPQADAAKR